MNKNELIETLKETDRLSKAEAKCLVDTFFDSMAEALVKGGRVEVRGMCSFYVKAYEGYTGRNPKTGELVTVKLKKLPFFKPGLDLKDRVDSLKQPVRQG